MSSKRISYVHMRSAHTVQKPHPRGGQARPQRDDSRESGHAERADTAPLQWD
jgi:hypothetical protein